VRWEERHIQYRIANRISVEILRAFDWALQSKNQALNVNMIQCCETLKGWLVVWFGWGVEIFLIFGRGLVFFHCYTLWVAGILCLTVCFTKPIRVVGSHIQVFYVLLFLRCSCNKLLDCRSGQLLLLEESFSRRASLQWI